MVIVPELRRDCRYFRGDAPCSYKMPSCRGCAHYSARGRSILIIKLAAIGDVLRTTPLLHALKKKYPRSYITWLTDNSAVGLLQNNTYIDRLLCYGQETNSRLLSEKFDLLLCLDKEAKVSGLASAVAARSKAGFGMHAPSGTLRALNPAANYALRLGVCDELKFRLNRKTYQEVIFEVCGLKYNSEEYIQYLSADDEDYALRLFTEMGISSGDKVIGLNTGSGSTFAHKAWTCDGFLSLIKKIGANIPEAKVLLFGGPSEAALNTSLALRAGSAARDTGTYHSLGQFSAMLKRCSLLVSGDTTAMHIAIAQRVPVVAIFGSTCHQEIDLYGRGEKVFSAIGCRPCYNRDCDKQENCMNSVTADAVCDAVQKLLRSV